MSERPVAIDAFHCAVFDDEQKTVHFKRLTLHGMADSRAPDRYKVPYGYTVIAAPRLWPAVATKWVV